MYTVTLAAGLLLIWFVFAQGQISSLVVGIPTIAGAVYCLRHMRSGAANTTWNPFACLKFIFYFVTGSIRGALDVGLRALHPAMPIQPVLFSYPLTDVPRSSRTALAAVVTLMPGTLAADIVEDTLLIHSLSTEPDVIGELETCARHVTALHATSTATPHSATRGAAETDPGATHA